MISEPNAPLDPYSVLGIPRDASADRVRKAYRRAAFQSHPDRNHGREREARAVFERVLEAFRILSDPLERAAWDRRNPPVSSKGRAAGRPAATGAGAPKRARRPERPHEEPPVRPPRRGGTALRTQRSDRAGRGESAEVAPSRGPLVLLALAAAATFAFAAKFVGFCLLAVGGRPFAPAPQRALYDRWFARIPAFLRPLPAVGRALLAVGLFATFYLTRLARPGPLVDAAENYGPAVLAAGAAVVLLERAAFGLFWALHAERSASVRGG